MAELRIPNIRFAPEVPVQECHRCNLDTRGHPLLIDIDNHDPNVSIYHKLCIKDCLKYKIPMEYNETTTCYHLKNIDSIQFIMKCNCIAKTPKGVEYHPSCKAVYWREGASGKFVKIGHRCPKCGTWYEKQ